MRLWMESPGDAWWPTTARCSPCSWSRGRPSASTSTRSGRTRGASTSSGARRSCCSSTATGDRYGVWKFFETDGTFRHWYVNFEAPIVRHDDGFDTDDHGLDLIVHPDGRREWKDVERPQRPDDRGTDLARRRSAVCSRPPRRSSTCSTPTPAGGRRGTTGRQPDGFVATARAQSSACRTRHRRLRDHRCLARLRGGPGRRRHPPARLDQRPRGRDRRPDGAAVQRAGHQRRGPGRHCSTRTAASASSRGTTAAPAAPTGRPTRRPRRHRGLRATTRCRCSTTSGSTGSCVMGWSMGVNTAFELALRNPERVAGLFAVAGVPGDTFATMLGPLRLPAPAGPPRRRRPRPGPASPAGGR